MSRIPANKVRREVMGDAFVDRAMQATDEFTGPLQDFINQHAWGSVWEREGLTRKERSLITLGALTALRLGRVTWAHPWCTQQWLHTRGSSRGIATLCHLCRSASIQRSF